LSILTKVLTLLVALLAIFLSGVVVVFVGNTANWKQAYEEQVGVARAAQTHAAVVDQTMGEMKARTQALQSRLTDAVTALEGRNAELMQEREAQAATAAASERKAQTATSVSASLSETLAKIRETRDFLESRLQEAHQAKLTAEAQAVELTQEVNRARAQVEQLNRIRARQEEKAQELQEELRVARARVDQAAVTASEGTAGTGVSFSQMQPAQVPIRGEILTLEGNRAEITVGSASGVQKGMELNVIRGAEYLGSLTVTNVESTRAVGTLTRKLGTIVAGDRVTSGFN